MFIVMWNCPGFLPGMDPWATESFGQAKAVVLAELQELLGEARPEPGDDLRDLEEIQSAVRLIEALACPFCVLAAGVAYSVTQVNQPLGNG